MAKLRIGIIGTGGISGCHMDGYRRLADKVEVVAACDIDEVKLKAYAAQHNIPNTYLDYNEMVTKEKLDAVSVTTWNAAHKGATIAALNAGINVICEKPMAMNAAEALEMEAAAKKSGKILMLGFVRRYGNDTKIVKDFIDAGALGDIYYAKATYLRRNGCPGGWFGDKKYSGGGPLIDLGVHVMDLSRYLAGSPKPVSAYGVTYSNLGPDRVKGAVVGYAPTSNIKTFEHTVEDFTTALIRFDNGFTLSVEASFNLNIKSDYGTIELFGTKAGIKLDPGVEIFSDMAGHYVNLTTYENSALSFSGIFEKEIEHFIDRVNDGKQPLSTANDGVMIMKIIDAIYESARTGSEAKITY
ncbi:oxidoreductase [Clostridia bacterium]|nr:oxidoreductase [Clostridia bacterium]